MISIEGYTDIERIGQGGLGDVYRAVRTSTGATVAIKVLRDVSDESVAWHRTRRELTALVSLAGHANVIQLIEVLDLPEGPALVMEHAPGGSVAELMLRRDRPLSVGETVLVGRQTATALMAAHERGIPVVGLSDTADGPLATTARTLLVAREVDVGAFRVPTAAMTLATSLAVAVGGMRKEGN